MLSNTQLDEFILCNTQKRENNEPSLTPDCMRHFMFHSVDLKQKAQELLEHVAFARLTEAENIVKQWPCLLSKQYASTVTTSSGLKVKDVTAYEFSLGALDRPMATMLRSNFDHFENGIKERDEQYAKYKSHIEKMEHAKPYDLKPLFEALLNSSYADVDAELNRHLDYQRYKDYQSALRTELEKFRLAMTPGILDQPGIHFNYNTLISAYALNKHYYYPFYHQYNEYEKRSNTTATATITTATAVDANYLVKPSARMKADLANCLIIAYILRNLTERDRQFYMHGNDTGYIAINTPETYIEHIETVPRNTEKYRTNTKVFGEIFVKFPATNTLADEQKYTNIPKLQGLRLGYDFSIDLGEECNIQRWAYVPERAADFELLIKLLQDKKKNDFIALHVPEQNYLSSLVNIPS